MRHVALCPLLLYPAGHCTPSPWSWDFLLPPGPLSSVPPHSPSHSEAGKDPTHLSYDGQALSPKSLALTWPPAPQVSPSPDILGVLLWEGGVS